VLTDRTVELATMYCKTVTVRLYHRRRGQPERFALISLDGWHVLDDVRDLWESGAFHSVAASLPFGMAVWEAHRAR